MSMCLVILMTEGRIWGYWRMADTFFFPNSKTSTSCMAGAAIFGTCLTVGPMREWQTVAPIRHHSRKPTSDLWFSNTLRNRGAMVDNSAASAHRQARRHLEFQ